MDNELLLSTQGGLDAATPIYTIGVAANLLNIHPRTLQLYEAEGLISPEYKGTRRLFSRADIHWARCLTFMIYELGINLSALKYLLEFMVCREIVDCQDEICPIYRNKKGRSAQKIAMDSAIFSIKKSEDGLFVKDFLPNISVN